LGGPKPPPKKAFFSFTKYTGTKLQLAISQNFEKAYWSNLADEMEKAASRNETRKL
jgi:hypothetical protein